LSFRTIEEDFRPTNPDGTLGAAVRVEFDQGRLEGGANGIRTEVSPATPAEGLTFQNADGTTTNEIPVTAYQWSASSTGLRASLQASRLVLDPRSADPQVGGVLASGHEFPRATLHVRSDAGESLPSLFEGVGVSSSQTADPGGQGDRIELSF